MLSNKTLVLLAAVLIALLAALRHAGPLLGRGADGEAPEATLLPASAAHPESVRFETAGFSAGLRLADSRWIFAPPDSGRADPNRISLSLDVALGAAVRDRVTARQREARGLGLADFGLDPPRARIELEGAGGKSGVSVGADTPDGSGVYALVDGRSEVAVVDHALIDLLPASLDDLRDRSVFVEPGREIESLEIRKPGSAPIRLERGADGLWRFAAPYVCAVDATNVGKLLDALSDATVGRFLRVPGDGDPPAAVESAFAAHGLGPEDVVLSLRVLVRGSSAPVECSFGGPDPADARAVVAGNLADGTVFSVDRAALDALLLPVSLLRDRRPFPFAPGEILRVSFRSEEGSFDFSRDAPASPWKIEAPSSQPASQEAVAAFVDRLLALRDEDAEPLPDGEPAPLDSIRADVVPAPPAEPISAVLSRRPAAEEGAPPDLLVSIPGRRIRHVVPGTAFPPEALSGSAFAALRDPSVLHVDPAAIVSLSRRDGAGSGQTVRRDAAGAWFCEEPVGSEPDAGAADAAAAAVSDLAAPETVALFTSDSAAYGLLPPRLELTVATRGGERAPDGTADGAARGDGTSADRKGPVAILQLGAARPDGSVFLRVKGEDPVFAVSAETASVLSAPLAR